MNDRVRWLRISYWVGGIFDGLMVLPMLSPTVGGAVFGIPDFDPGPEYRYAMGVGASLMAGWTLLLFWADRKPVERRGVLLLTVLHVLLGQLIEVRNMLLTWIFQAVLAALFLFSYLRATGLEETGSGLGLDPTTAS